MDVKRFFLLLRKRWYTVMIAFILGALISGVSYQIYYRNTTKNPKYQAEGIFYINANEKEAYIYFNSYTWGDEIRKERILGPAYEVIEKKYAFLGITKEEMRESVSASILSDLRILVVDIQNESKEKCEAMIEGFSKSICDFPEVVDEFNSIDSWGFEDTKLLMKPNLWTQAVVLGMTIAFIVWMICYLMYYAIEDSICTENDLTCKNEISFVGYRTKKKNEFLESLTESNLLELQKDGEVWEPSITRVYLGDRLWKQFDTGSPERYDVELIGERLFVTDHDLKQITCYDAQLEESATIDGEYVSTYYSNAVTSEKGSEYWLIPEGRICAIPVRNQDHVRCLASTELESAALEDICYSNTANWESYDLLNASGEIVQSGYDYLYSTYYPGIFAAMRGARWGIIDKDGNWLWSEYIYDE